MRTQLCRITISIVVISTTIIGTAKISHSGMQNLGTFRSMAACEAAMQALLRAGKITQYACVPIPSKELPKRVALPERVGNTLKNYRSLKVQVGSSTYIVDRYDMSHILKRHHPNYWDGSIRGTQTFFNEKMTISQIQQAIRLVLIRRQNEVMKIGPNGIAQLPPTQVGGVTYLLGLNKGHVGQFYPIVP